MNSNLSFQTDLYFSFDTLLELATLYTKSKPTIETKLRLLNDSRNNTLISSQISDPTQLAIETEARKSIHLFNKVSVKEGERRIPTH